METILIPPGLRPLFLYILAAGIFFAGSIRTQAGNPELVYTVTMPQPGSHKFHLELQCNGLRGDTITFRMPRWMPGYYQIMNYAQNLENLAATDDNGSNLTVIPVNENTWRIPGVSGKPFRVTYDVKADRRFVANSYLDTTHAYIVPEALFLYIEGSLDLPVLVKIDCSDRWTGIATGLDPVFGTSREFTAPDFDILYDCPLLIGELEELPSFRVNGIEHRFIGYGMGAFDRHLFMDNLKKVVESAVALMGDIPYKQYTFIGIGPGRGGIEHLNNTTVTFTGEGLETPEGMAGTMGFLGHEYFHNYNVKRIRPFELGPFDYDRGNKTYLLWVSEGLSVYYEYLVLERAGLMNERQLLDRFAQDITTLENNPGRKHQSLAQASYETWSDGPFGKQGADAGKSISYYVKGPVVGLLLDFAIRHATENSKSLDDVIRYLYNHYYKKLGRGFTDAEFQRSCEEIAGTSLVKFFEYIYTTKDLNYDKYLSYAGLELKEYAGTDKGARKFMLRRKADVTPAQEAVLQDWLAR